MDRVDPYTEVLAQLARAGVRFLAIGLGGANLYATPGANLFATQDLDVFLPRDPPNLLSCWQALLDRGWELWCHDEPLDKPRDLWLAERVILHEAAVQASRPDQLKIDLTLVMKGFRFEDVWAERRIFVVEGVEVPVARLKHIVESKRLTGRPKDHLFFVTHEEILAEILAREERRASAT